MSARRLKAKRQRKANEKRYQSDPDHELVNTLTSAVISDPGKHKKERAQRRSASEPMKYFPQNTENGDGKQILSKPRSSYLEDFNSQVAKDLSQLGDSAVLNVSLDSKYSYSQESGEVQGRLLDFKDALTGVFSNFASAAGNLFGSESDPVDLEEYERNRIPGNSDVPAEIRVRGPQACAAYQEALEDGKTKDRRLLVMVVGQARTGKTSTIRSLRGEDFNPNEDSTVGITLDRSFGELKDEAWGKVDETGDAAAEVSYDHVMAKAIAEKLKTSPGNNAETSPVAGESLNSPENLGSSDNQAAVQHTTVIKVPEDIAGLTQQLLQDLQHTKDTKCIYSTTWDFAGQPAYSATHPVFLSSSAIYILVHDLGTDLHAQATPVVRNGAYERSINLSCPLTNMDCLELWMSSISDISNEEDAFFPTQSEGNSKQINSAQTQCSLADDAGKNESLPTEQGGSRYVDVPSASMEVPLITADGAAKSCSNPSRPKDANKVPHSEANFSSREESSVCFTDKADTTSTIITPQGIHQNKNKKGCKLPKRVPPVFLVCTHSDEPFEGKDPLQIGREVLATLKSKISGHHLVRGLYTVDNSCAGKDPEDQNIKKLRKNIYEVAQKLTHMKKDIPIRWLQFEKTVASLVERGYKYVKLPEAVSLARDVCRIVTEQEFRTLLNYLHDLKIIIHFEDTIELNQLVILDPQWLAEMFASIITVQPIECQDDEYADCWKELETNGILDPRLVQHVLDEIIDDRDTVDTLLSIMQKFSLLCKWHRPDGSQVFLVPSMLMHQADIQVQELVSSSGVLPIVVQFKSGFLPLGFFPRFLFLLVEWYTRNWTHSSQPKFFNNFARFYLGSKKNFSLMVTCDLSTLSLVVREENTAETMELPPFTPKDSEPFPRLEETLETFCQATMAFLKTTLKKMRVDYPWMRNMQTELSIRCPVCLVHNQANLCKNHKQTCCTRDACMHYITEKELQHNETVTCFQSPMASKPVIDKELFLPWFDEDEEDMGCTADGVLLRDDSGRGIVPHAMEAVFLRDANGSDVANKLAEILDVNRQSLEHPPLDVVKKVRGFCKYLKRNNRLDIVMSLRQTLPSGTTGPLLPENGLVRQLQYDKRKELTQALSGGDDWKVFASHLGVPADQLRFYDKRTEDPAERILAEFERKTGKLKIGELYDILTMCELNAYADKL